jgi:hypothetical protein
MAVSTSVTHSSVLPSAICVQMSFACLMTMPSTASPLRSAFSSATSASPTSWRMES